MNYAVNCTSKDSKYERIKEIGCTNSTGFTERFTEDEVLTRLRAGDMFTVTRDGHTVKLVEAEHEGRPYVKTERDGVRADNLLALPHCPPRQTPIIPPTRTIPTSSHSV